jgi:predicted Zn finger-like uncharacterized protein
MILVCPTCNTRYMVEDEMVRRPSGRVVRCANCGYSWHHVAAQPASLSRLRERLEAATTTELTMPARPETAGPAAQRHRRGTGLAWVVLILLIGAAIVGAILGREKIVAMWPAAAQYYELVGLKTLPLGTGLDIANVTSTRNADGLIVEGDITNKMNVPRTVPHLRVAVRDAGLHELIFKIVEPPRERLLPGETSHFVVGFLPAPDAATGVLVTFAAG